MSAYIAQFLPDQERPGIYHVSFPDLPGCVTLGGSIEEAVAQAADALAGYLEVELDRGEDLPLPSNMAGARKKAEEQAKKLKIALQPETHYQLVSAEPRLVAPESAAIWMQRGLLARARRVASQQDMSFSRLVEVAIREYVKKSEAEKYDANA